MENLSNSSVQPCMSELAPGFSNLDHPVTVQSEESCENSVSVDSHDNSESNAPNKVGGSDVADTSELKDLIPPPKKSRIDPATEPVTQPLQSKLLSEVASNSSYEENETIAFIARHVHEFNNLDSGHSVGAFWKSLAEGMRNNKDNFTAAILENMWNRVCIMHPNSELYVHCQSKSTTDMHVVAYFASNNVHTNITTNTNTHSTITATTTNCVANTNKIARWARDWYIKYLYQRPRDVYTAYTMYQQQKNELVYNKPMHVDNVHRALLSIVFAVELSVQTDMNVSQDTQSQSTSMDTIREKDTLPPVYLYNIFSLQLPLYTLPTGFNRSLWIQKQASSSGRHGGLVRTTDGFKSRKNRNITLDMLRPVQTTPHVAVPIHVSTSASKSAHIRECIIPVPVNVPTTRTSFCLDATPIVLIKDKVKKKKSSGSKSKQAIVEDNDYW